MQTMAVEDDEHNVVHLPGNIHAQNHWKPQVTQVKYLSRMKLEVRYDLPNGNFFLR